MEILEKRLHRVIANLNGNEALAASLDDDAASELLSWGETSARRIVEQTDGMDDDAAEEHMVPKLRALRLMMRAIGRWVGEAQSLDHESHLALWNRVGEQAKVLFGESFSLPSMDETLALLPSNASTGQTVAWLKNFIEDKGTKG